MSEKLIKGILVAGGFAAGFATSRFLDSRSSEAVEEPEERLAGRDHIGRNRRQDQAHRHPLVHLTEERIRRLNGGVRKSIGPPAHAASV